MSSNDTTLQTPRAALPGKKYFTVEEANRALPYLARIVDDVVHSYARLVELRRHLESARPAQGAAQLEQEYDGAMDRLGALIDELDDAGVQLKDFEKGLVDFPALHEHREVQLCWQRGEAGVDHWHEVDAGFAGRQPVTLIQQQ